MDLPVLIMDTTEQLPDPPGGLRRGIATLQVSMLFMGRTDTPAHLGSFSRASALLQRLRMQGRWHVVGCVANEAVWAAHAALVTGFSCMPSSHGQNLLFISDLPIFAAKNRRKTASLAEFRHHGVFADKQQLVKGLTAGEGSFADWTG